MKLLYLLVFQVGHVYRLALIQEFVYENVVGKGDRKVGKYFLLDHWIVHQNLLLVNLAAELFSDGGVPGGDATSQHRYFRTRVRNQEPSSTQGGKLQCEPFIVVLDRGDEVALFVNLRVLVQQIFIRNLYSPEEHPAIVHSVDSELWATVPEVDPGQNFSFGISYFYHEDVDAMVDFVHNQIGEAHSVIGCLGQISYPKLHSVFMGSVEDEGSGWVVVVGEGEERLHVGAMGDFSHHEAAHHV